MLMNEIGHCELTSDVVLQADASPSPRGRKFSDLMPQPHASWASISNCIASASEKLPLPRLGLDLTASVLPWCASALAHPISAAVVATVTLKLHPHYLFSCSQFLVYYCILQQQSTFYIQWFLYAILVPALPRHGLGLLLPRLEH